MSSREEKIRALQLIREGSLPAKFADPDRFRILEGMPDLGCYVTKDGEKVSIQEQQIFKKYFPESFVFVSVAGMTREEIARVNEIFI
jgi:hypothetical protein